MTAPLTSRPVPTTRGVLFVHSAPSALCPHLEWAVGGVLGAAVSLEWSPQPAQAGSLPRRAVLLRRARDRRSDRLGSARLEPPALRGDRGSHAPVRGRALLLHP